MANVKRAAAITLAWMLTGTNVIAAEPTDLPPTARFFLGMGLTHGGEELAEIRVIYDDERSDEDIRSGELVSFAGGMIFPLWVPAFSIQASAGYHFDSVSTYDDDVYFGRIPLELIPFYNFGHHRIGAGLSYHLNPELDLKDAGGPKFEFDDAPGALVQYDYSFAGWNSNGILLGFRYMWIDYEIDQVDGTRVSGDKVDGDHFGVHFSYMF